MTFSVLRYSFLVSLLTLVVGCGAYSFTGISISAETKTFQVNYFQNTSALIEPGIERDFTLALQDLILNQTNLGLVKSNGDILYENVVALPKHVNKKLRLINTKNGFIEILN